jgi:hypothetical protein
MIQQLQSYFNGLIGIQHDEVMLRKAVTLDDVVHAA